MLRSVLLACTAWLGLAKPATAQARAGGHEAEASANFDAEDVAPVLLRVSRLLSAGFTEAEARSLAERINAQDLDSEQAYEYQVTYRGTWVSLRITAFMDDVEAPDIAFFTSPALATAVDEQIAAYMEEVGK